LSSKNQQVAEIFPDKDKHSAQKRTGATVLHRSGSAEKLFNSQL
jgi:hypothetical protein